MKFKFEISLAVVVTILLVIAAGCKKEDDLPTAVKDIDGNEYETIKIGTQVWMKQNLMTIHFRNGDPVPTTQNPTEDISEETDPIYQWTYNAVENNAFEYGRLYTWYAVTDPRGLCPEGWHVPTDADWVTLFKELGGIDAAGAQLMEAGTDHWPAPNTNTTNGSDFTAMPGGCRFYMWNFMYIDEIGYYWTSSPRNSTDAYYYLFTSSPAKVQQATYNKKFGFSVRCVKD
jgi:uncharacterized protein (TIGR02145 family)